VHSVDQKVGASSIVSSSTKDKQVAERHQSGISQGNVVRLPLPLELSVEQDSAVHESASSHVWEFSSIGKINIDKVGLFELPMHITLNSDTLVNELCWNNGSEGPLTRCANHSSQLSEVNKVNRGMGSRTQVHKLLKRL
jgi:hypothetical protein